METPNHDPQPDNAPQEEHTQKFNLRLRQAAKYLIALTLLGGIITAVLYHYQRVEVLPMLVLEDSLAVKAPLPGDEPLATPDEVSVSTKTIHFREQAFDVFRMDAEQQQLHFFWKDQRGEIIRKFEKIVDTFTQQNQKVLLITNAGIFNSDYSPAGLFVSDGQELCPINQKEGAGNFYLKPNGVFYQTKEGKLGVKPTEEFQIPAKVLLFATQSGPILLTNNEIHPAFNEGSSNVYIRSGVGVTTDGKAVFAISQLPVNFYDFARLFRDVLSCPDALYLDGAISELYAPALKRQNLGGGFAGIIAVTPLTK